MMNMATLQGTDNSIQSGIMAADTLIKNWERIEKGDGLNYAFRNVMRESEVNQELYKSRSTRGMFEKGLFAGMAYSVSYELLTTAFSFECYYSNRSISYIPTQSNRAIDGSFKTNIQIMISSFPAYFLEIGIYSLIQ